MALDQAHENLILDVALSQKKLDFPDCLAAD